MKLPPGFKPLKPEDLFVKGKLRIYTAVEGSIYGSYFYYDGKSSYLKSDKGERVDVSSPIAMRL